MPNSAPFRRALATALALGPAPLLFAACALGSAPRLRPDLPPPVPPGTVVQVGAGAGQLNEGLVYRRQSPTNPGQRVEAEVDTLLVFSVGGQQPFFQTDPQVGFDAGLVFSWGEDDSEIEDSATGAAALEADIELFVVEVFAGLYTATDLGPVRLHAAVGPELLIADLDLEDEVSERGDTNYVVGGYARAGLELRLPQGDYLGVSVRGVAAELDFNEGLGDFDFEGLQWMLTFMRRF